MSSHNPHAPVWTVTRGSRWRRYLVRSTRVWWWQMEAREGAGSVQCPGVPGTPSQVKGQLRLSVPQLPGEKEARVGRRLGVGGRIWRVWDT